MSEEISGYRYKVDFYNIESNSTNKLMYTLIEQNEKIINLLKEMRNKDATVTVTTSDAQTITLETTDKPDKKYKCDLCPESFNTPIEKGRHMRSHKGVKCDGQNTN